MTWTLISQDTLTRIAKTIGEVAVAITTVEATVPNASTAVHAVSVVGGSGLAALLLNVGISYFTTAKSKWLDRIAQAIDNAVDARLAAQAEVPSPSQAGIPQTGV